jgi:hypothetical protein
MTTVPRRAIAIALAAFAFVVALWAAISIASDRPTTYDDIAEHFKYGSIGSEPGVSLLRPVGGVLPPLSVFTRCIHLPGKAAGWLRVARVRLREGPHAAIGVSQRRRIGIDHVGLNCAVCHTGTVRDAPDAEPRVVLGMPAHQLDLQRFVEFVLECSLDNRTTRRQCAAACSRTACRYRCSNACCFDSGWWTG